jgi:DNA repair protein RadA/Sms
VLEKREGMMLAGSDAYVNLAGGMKVGEPALDLGIVAALVSSFKDAGVDAQTVFFGEVGLAGEIRGVTMAEQRAKEAAKMGFTTCILPKSNAEVMKKIPGMKLVGVSKLSEVIELI